MISRREKSLFATFSGTALCAVACSISMRRRSSLCLSIKTGSTTPEASQMVYIPRESRYRHILISSSSQEPTPEPHFVLEPFVRVQPLVVLHIPPGAPWGCRSSQIFLHSRRQATRGMLMDVVLHSIRFDRFLSRGPIRNLVFFLFMNSRFSPHRGATCL
ncbi:hypothetical protein EDB89DRAFT_1973122 [Lactarius sanguifluus]|nr:hypothetical protein EDB89DRAFT_1973122 [Lactarius sanguifluus]